MSDKDKVFELMKSNNGILNVELTTYGENGFIDLGRSGIADKYQDIALCYRSLRHNFDGRYGEKVYEGFDVIMFFDELNIVPDWNKIKFYILMDELFYDNAAGRLNYLYRNIMM